MDFTNIIVLLKNFASSLGAQTDMMKNRLRGRNFHSRQIELQYYAHRYRYSQNLDIGGLIYAKKLSWQCSSWSAEQFSHTLTRLLERSHSSQLVKSTFITSHFSNMIFLQPAHIWKKEMPTVMTCLIWGDIFKRVMVIAALMSSRPLPLPELSIFLFFYL